MRGLKQVIDGNVVRRFAIANPEHAPYGRAAEQALRKLGLWDALQGKLVLEITIAPSGEVTMARIVSSELADPDLERKIVARVRLFRFAARDVEAITATKPIDFFPA